MAMAPFWCAVFLAILGSASSQSLDCNTGSLRLVGGNSHLLGRVELCYNNSWGTVCSYSWDDVDAKVVCSQLGYSPQEAANVGSIFGNGNGTILLSGVNCLGTEERLIDCPRSFPIGMTSCTHSQDVGVVCQPRIFPVGSQNAIRVINDDSSINTEIATVNFINNLLTAFTQAFSHYCFPNNSIISSLCYEHELTNSTGLQFGSNFLPMLAINIRNASSVIIPSSIIRNNLVFVSVDMYYIVYYQKGAVVVETVLKGGKVLEILQENTALLNFYGITNITLELVSNCNSICLNGGVCSREIVGEVGGMCVCLPGYTGDRCETENSPSCEDYCLNDGVCVQGTDSEMGMICMCLLGYSGDRCEVRQVSCGAEVEPCLNGGICVQGTPDMCQCPFGFNGTLCQIDLPFCNPLSCASNGTCIDLYGPNTSCSCLPGFTGSRCEINETCSTGDVRLVGGSSHLEGRVEYCVGNQWGTVCGNMWENEDAAVVCTQLGFSSQAPLSVGNKFGSGSGPIFLSDVNCNGTEQRLLHCLLSSPVGCFHSQDIGIMCQPDIPGTIILMNSIVASARNIIENLMAFNGFVDNLRLGFELAFYEHCFNHNQSVISNTCFEMDLSGSQSNVPLTIQSIQTISAIMVPQSLILSDEGRVSEIQLYYYLYYQQRESVILIDTALDILRANSTIFSALGINEVSFRAVAEPTTLPPTVPTQVTEVFCPNETDSMWMLSYPSTQPGVNISIPCPSSTMTSGYIAMTSRLCREGGEWGEIDVSACQRDEFRNISIKAIEVFNATNVDPVAVESVLTELVMATMPSINNISEFPRDLDTTNNVVSLAVEFLMQDLLSDDPIDLSTQVVDIIDNVLDTSNKNGWNAFAEEEAGSERLLNNAEQYGVYFAAALINPNVTINATDVQDKTLSRNNIVVRAEPVDRNNVSDILFPKNVDTIKVENFGSAQSRLSRSFLIERGAESMELSAVNLIFRNLEEFLPMDGLSNVTRPATSVISTQIISVEPGSISTMNTTTNKTAEFRFTTIAFGSDVEVKNPMCAFWDFTSSKNLSSSSWSTKNVETKIISENEKDNTFTVECTSSHLTSFAVLLDVNDATRTFNEVELRALTYVTYIGCGISIACLLFSILFFVFVLRTELFKSAHYFIHLNLSIALILAYITFLAGIDTAVNNRIGCVFVAALLHYLFLSVFCWMLCEGVMLYLMLVVVFSSLSKKWWLFFILGWGPPIVIVVISVGIIHEQYGTTEFCWISASDPKVGALWAFAGPMLGVILLNVIFLLAALRSLYKVRKAKLKQKSDKKALFKELFIASIILLPLLGLTWVFGLLSINQGTSVFAWIFTVCNSLQGMFIFIFHVLRSDRVCGKKSRESLTSKVSSGQRTLFSRLTSNKKSDTSLLIKSSSAHQRSSSSVNYMVNSSSFMSQASDSIIESKRLTTLEEEKHEDNKIDIASGEGVNYRYVDGDELAELDTTMFMTKEEQEKENDSDRSNKFKYTMTVNWMS